MRKHFKLPTGDKLLNLQSREKYPTLGNRDELAFQALMFVKYFSLDSHWTWCDNEFNGRDTFWGLEDGYVAEVVCFSLSKSQFVKSLLGLPVEQGLYFGPKIPKKLIVFRKNQRYL
jgi:hypothetical protein